MVSISADQYDVIEFPVKCEFVCVKGKPCVYSFLNDSTSWVFAQVLIMEDDVIFYESIFEGSFYQQKIFVFCILCTVSSSVIMGLSDLKMLFVYSE